VLDGKWVASLLGHFEDPTVAGVSILRRGTLPGVVALMARRAAYRALQAPVLAPSYEGLERWPHPTKRRAGDRAALALRARGKKIVEVSRGGGPAPRGFQRRYRDPDRARGVRRRSRPAL